MLRFLFLFFLSFSCLSAEIYLDLDRTDYIFCVDGGATKMSLQVINSEGELLDLLHDNVHQDYLQVSSGNICEEGADAVLRAISQLFNGLSVEGLEISEIVPKSHFLAGVAGIEAVGANEQEKVQKELQRYGFITNNITLINDGVLVLEALGEKGAIVIAGTGSICLDKKGGEILRAGGLGLVLGNEGSGYRIGLNAIKAAIADQQGWGEYTVIREALIERIGIERAEELVHLITSHQMATSEIASLSPLVFHYASLEDNVAKEILHSNACQLGLLLANVIERVDQKQCEVLLVGGVFKGIHAQLYLDSLLSSEEMSHIMLQYQPLIKNVADDNPALLAGRRILKRSKKR